jgi:RNA polymerase sigma-54 factor
MLQQLPFSTDNEDPLVVEFAEYLIANLDSHGFLSDTLEALRLNYEKPVTEDLAERSLQIIQSLEPTGVGARDLRECLLLQLREPPPSIENVDVLRAIIGNHLEDLKHNRLPVIERKTGYSLETLRDAIHELRFLDLNPGAKFSSAKTQYVVPDVVVERDPDHPGEYMIKMNEENTPNVYISKDYLNMIREKQGDPKALEFLKRKITAARWLIDSIEQRRNTLEKVTRAIIDHQKDFLERGPDYIEPLKMQQIADKVGVHVTTVSRAVDDKWVQTPRGIFPLKSFFGGGTVTSDGQEVAYDTIKRKLTEIVGSEDKSNPYSDDELVKKLGEHGYPLARRTVTKYRKMLSIPSSRQRKQHF